MVWGIIAAVIAVVASAGVYYQQKKMEAQAAKQAQEAKAVQVSGHDSNRGLYTVYGQTLVGSTIVWKTVTDKEARITQSGFTTISAATGSHLTTNKDHKNNRWLYRAVTLCNGPVTEITNVTIDDEGYRSPRFTNKTTKHFATTYSVGPTAGQNFSALRNAYASDFSTWASDAVGKGVAYAIERLYLHKDKPAYQGEPQTRYRVKGRALYDPRKDSTSSAYDSNLGTSSHRADTATTWEYSDNPVLALLDYMRSGEYGRGLDLSVIDIDSIAVSADKCDVLVDIPQRLANDTGSVVTYYDPETGEVYVVTVNGDYPYYRADQQTTGVNANKQRRFRINMAVDPSKEILDNIQEILNVFRGNLSYANGKYFVHMADVASPVLTLNDDDIIGGLKIANGDRSQRMNRATVKFINQAKQYKTDQVSWPSLDSNEDGGLYATYLTQDEDEKLHRTFTVKGCTDFYQAQDTAEFLVRDSRSNLSVSGTFGSRCFGLIPGDVVALDYDSSGFSGKYFRVIQTQVDLVSMNVGLQLKEYDSSVYTWNTSRGNEPLGLSWQEEVVNADPTNLTIGTIVANTRTRADGSTALTLTVPFSDVPEAAQYVEISWAINNTNDYNTQLVFDTENQTQTEVAIERDGETYAIRARYFATNSYGTLMPSAYTETTHAVADLSGTKLDGIDDGATQNTGDLADLDTVDTDQIDNDAITVAKLDTSLESTNYQAGVSGWKLTKAGVFEAGDGDFRGTVKATVLDVEDANVHGTLTATNIAAGIVTADTLAADVFAEFDDRYGGSGGFYRADNDEFFDGSATKLVPLAAVTHDSAKSIRFQCNLVHAWGTTSGYGGTNGLKLRVTFEYSADNSTWAKVPGSGENSNDYYERSATVTIYSVAGAFDIAVDIRYEMTGSSLSDNTAYYFRVKIEYVSATNAYTSSSVPGNSLYNGVPIKFNVQQTSGLTASSGDADTVDGLQASQFLRSDTSDTLSGNLIVTGNLTVQGSQTQLETQTLTVEDNNIVLNHSTGDSSGSADDAGITIQDAVNSTTDASLLWKATGDYFQFSHPINAISSTSNAYAADFRGAPQPFGSSGVVSNGVKITAGSSSNDTVLLVQELDNTAILTINGFGLATFANSVTIDGQSVTGTKIGQWNTAYTYSQVGHLPLSGGTVAGNLTVNHSSSSGVNISATDVNANQEFYAQKITLNTSGDTALSADRNHIGLFLDVNATATGGNTGDEHRVYGVYADVQSSGDSDLVYGVHGAARTNNFGSGQVTNVRGTYGLGSAHHNAATVINTVGAYNYALNQTDGTGQANSIYGAYNHAYAGSSSSYTGSNYYGSWNLAQISSVQTANINTAHAVYGEVQLDNTTDAGHDVTIANSFVFRARHDENDADDTYTVNNGYLFHGDYTGTRPTNAWGIYISSDVDNYFAGNVRTAAAFKIGNETVIDASRNAFFNRVDTDSSIRYLQATDTNIVFDDGTITFNGGAYTFNGSITGTGRGTFDQLTLTGSTDNLTINEASGDWTINNAQQNNGITIYDGSSGVVINYNGSAVAQFDNGGGMDLLSGNLQINGVSRITAAGNATLGSISSGAITSTGSSLINTLQVGTNTQQNTYGRLQVNQSANVDEAGIGILSQNAGRSMRLWVDETNSYINSGNAGSGFLYLNQDVRVTNEGNFERTGSHISGFQIGGYDSIENSREKSNPIHVIGSAYLPTETSTNTTMYGIGFTRGSGYFADLSWTNGDGWGLYAAAGSPRIFLDAENGVLEGTGGVAINGTTFVDSSRNITAGTISSAAITSTGTSSFAALNVNGSSVLTSGSQITTAGAIVAGDASSALGYYVGANQVIDGNRALKNITSIETSGNITGSSTGYVRAKSLRLENSEVADADFTSAYQMIVDANDSLSIMSNKGDFTGGYPFGIFFLGDNGGTTKTLGSGLVGVWNTTNFKKVHVDYFVSLYDSGVTATEYDYLDGVTSNIQTQLNNRYEANDNLSVGTISSGAITATGTNNVYAATFTGAGGPSVTSNGVKISAGADFNDTTLLVEALDGTDIFKIDGSGVGSFSQRISVQSQDVTGTRIQNWQTAYGWGDHSTAGYLTSLNFNDLSNKTAGTGDYSTNGDLVAGRGSGGVALTINDGKGNANVTFNHQNGVPEQDGNAARIEVNTDSSSSASMYFEVKSDVTNGVGVDLTPIFRANETGLYMESGKVIYGTGGVTIQANDVDFIVEDTTDSTTNFIWRDFSGSKLYLGTSTAQVEFRSHVTQEAGYNITSSGNITTSGIIEATKFRVERGGYETALVFEDSYGNDSIIHSVNDSQGNYSIMVGVNDAGTTTTAGYGQTKILMSAHGQNGAVSLNAGPIQATAGSTANYSISIMADSTDNTIRVGNPNDNVGGDPASLTKVFDNSANAFASSYSVGSDTVISSTRRFYASNGTTVKAAYSFDGDSGTGISRTAAGRIDFLSSGAVKAYIQTGTSNPISPTMYVDGRTEINDVVTWSGGSSTNANTAYTYSQVGHLPLAGGTMTGELKTRALTIINPVATGRVEIGTIANDQQNGYVRGSVIFSRDENQITFDTTTDQWVHAGGSSTDWSMIAHHSSGVSFYTGSALASSTSYTNAQFASAYRWLEVPTGTKTPDFKVRPTVSGNNIWHAGDFSNNSSNWDSAYTYSQVGHLPLSGGTITGSLTVNNRVSFTDDDITSLSTEINTLNNGGLSIALDANNEVASTDFRVRIDRSSGDSQLVLDASGNLDVENNVTAVSFITGTASSALGIYAGSTQVFEGSTRNLKNLGTINSGSITSTGNITAGTTTGYLYAKSLRLENGEVSDADFQSAYQMIVDANDSLSIMSNKGDFTGGYPFGIFFLGDNGGTTKTLGSGLVGVWNTTNFKKAHVDHMVGLYDNTQDLTAPNISVTGNLDIAQYIRHAGDTNTSIGFTDSDQITVSTGGTARVSITNSDFVFKNTQVQFDSTMGLGASTYSPLESGATSERNWLNFHLTDNASYIEITNRTPSGKVVLSGGLDGGGGEVQRLEIEGGSGTQDVRLLTSTNLDITAGNLKLNNIIRINNAGNATFGTISGSALTVTNSGMPTLTLYDNGNGGGGASEAKIQFQNTAGTAIAIGYTDDSSVDSDLVISTNAAGTYGGYLGLSAAAIADAQSDIILEPKTDVRIATGGLKVGTDTVISSTRRVYASSGTSVKAALSFDGDSGTGLSNTTSGQIDFLSSGAVKAYIRTGTTNPISDTMYVDGQLGVNGNVVWSGGTSTNANTAYGWGDHSAAGYLGTNDNITVGTISCGAISSTGSSLINTLQVGANTNQNAYGRLQVNQSANVDEAGIGILSQNAGRSMRLWVDETHSYINSGNAGSGFLYLNEDVRVTNEGNFERTGSHISGCQIGGYDAIANSREKSNPIHVIGSNYLPTETSTNNNMYGIGFTRGSGYFSDLSWTNGDGWGLYASAGAARIFLDAENGVLESTGGIAINGTVFCDAARDISVRDIVAAGTVSSSAGTVGTAANILSIKTSTEANTAAGDVYAGIRFQVSGAENSTGTISDNTVAAIKAIDYRSGTTSFEDAGLGFYTLDTDESAHTFRGGFSNAGGFFVSVDGNVDQNTGEGDIYADSNVSAGNNIVFNNQLRFASDTLIDNQKTFYINTISITDGDFAVIDENNTGENNIIWRDYSADRLYLGTTTDVVEFRGDVNFQSGHTLSHDGNIILDAARNVANLGTIASNRVTATVNSAIEYSTTEDSELNAVGSDALFLFNSENTSTNGKVSIMMRNAGGGGTATGRITLKNERSGNSGFGFFLRDGSHTANQQEKMFLDSDGDLSITGAFTSSGAIVGSTVQATGNLFGTNGLHTLNTAGNAWDHTINRNGGNPTANLPGGITSGAITSSGAVTASNFIGTGNLTVTGNAHELGAGSNQTVFLDFKSTTDAVIELNNSTKITIGTTLTSFTQDISTSLGKYHYFGTTAQDTKIGTGLNGRLDFDVNGAGFIRLDGLSSTHEVDILKQLNLNSNNVVGVGTFTSSGLMTVTAGSGAEGITIRGRSSDNISELTFSNNAGSSSIGGLQARNTDMRLRTIGSIPLLLQTDNTERGRLHNTGELTIGKNSASIGIGAYDSTSIWQHGMITTTVYNHGDVQEPTDEQANGALSGYYSFINSGSVYVGCVEPNTVIYEYDPSNGAEKVFAVRGPEDASSVTVVADRIYRSRNQPFVMHLNGDHSAMVPLAYTGQYFGFYTNRYTPDSVRFYAPDGGCTINVYRDNGISSGTVDQTITLLPQEAKTTALTSASGYFVFEVVGGHVIASVTAPSGDRDILRPASRIRVFGDNSFGIGGDYEIFSGGGAANDSNRVVYSQDEPVIASKIGDGDGGDCLTGVPLQMLCDNYLIPHSVAGMSYVAVYPDTEIKTYYHNGTTWVLAESKSLDGRLLTADDDQVGNMDSGGSSHINSGGRTIWVTGNKPFMASTNDPGADEYELVGWLSKYRAVAPAEPRVMALSGGTQTDPAVTFENDDDTGIYRNADNKIGFTAGGTVRATIATDGIVTSGNVTAYGSPSDIRLKENVERIADPIDKVKQLDGITFDYKKDGSRSTGLIAQQLLEVLPEVVYQTDDIETGNTHYAVRYGQVVGLLVEAVKELTQRIEELENGDN